MQLTNRNERIEIFHENKLVGFVEDEMLSAIDAKGYSVEISAITQPTEIIEKLSKWRDANISIKPKLRLYKPLRRY